MAEPFGIAAAFTACIDCSEYIQVRRRFGREFQTDLLSLSCVRLRLIRWGESIKIYNDPTRGRPDATAPEIQLAKNMLLQIVGLFAKTEEILKKYMLTAKGGEDLSAFSVIDMNPALMALKKKQDERVSN